MENVEDGWKTEEDVWKMDVCMCASKEMCVYVVVVVVVAAACLAVLARAVRLSLAMLPAAGCAPAA